MDTIQEFMQELVEVQEKYGLFIVTESGDPMLVSLDQTASNHSVVCILNDTVINPLSDKAAIDLINLRKLKAE